MPLPSFIFNAEKETPETLARRRALAEAMLNRGQTGVASNVGEGLAQLGQAISGRIGVNRADGIAAKRKAAAYGMLGPAFAPMAPAAAPDAPLAGGAGSDMLAGGTGGDIAGGFGSVLSAGKGWTEVMTSDGKAVRRQGARNWRNNNPGNIEFGNFAKSAGAIGTDGRFAVFPSFEAGNAAQEKLLFGSPSYRNKTIAGAISRYAPSFENNTGSYIAQVAAAAGVSPNTPMSALSPEQRQAMLKAMHRVEGFKVGKEFAANGAPIPQAAPQPATPPPMASGTAMTGFPPVPPAQAPQMAPQAPTVVPASAPPPMATQAPAAPQAPMSAYQRMMMQSLGKEAGGLSAPPNRAQMAAVMGHGGQPSGGGILSNVFGGGSAPAPAVSPFAAPQAPTSAPTPAPAGDKLSQLQSFIAGPDFAWLEPAQQKFVMDEYEREQAAANPDPMAKVQLETAQVNLDKLKNPKPEQPRTTTIDGVLLVEQPDKSWKPAYTAPPDPKSALDLEKLRLEVERLKNPKPEQPRTTTIDGVLLVEQPDKSWKPAYTAPQKTEKPPAGVQEYEYYRQQAIAAGQTPVDFMTWKKSNTPSTNVTVTNGVEPPDNKLREGIDKAEGDQLVKYKDAAAVSGQNAQDFATLEELIKIAPQGPITGRLAEAFPGFSSSGDALRSIVVRIAPTLRAPGSGSTSDIEYDGMLKSLPALRNNPQANVAILQIMKDKATLNVKRGEVITRYQTGEIPASQMRKELNELNKISIISPEMKKQLSGLGAQSSEAPPAAVQPSQPESGSGDFLPETLSIIRQKQGFTSDQQALDYLTKKKAEGWTIAPNGVMYQEVK